MSRRHLIATLVSLTAFAITPAVAAGSTGSFGFTVGGNAGLGPYNCSGSAILATHGNAALGSVTEGCNNSLYGKVTKITICDAAGYCSAGANIVAATGSTTPNSSSTATTGKSGYYGQWGVIAEYWQGGCYNCSYYDNLFDHYTPPCQYNPGQPGIVSQVHCAAGAVFNVLPTANGSSVSGGKPGIRITNVHVLRGKALSGFLRSRHIRLSSAPPRHLSSTRLTTRGRAAVWHALGR